jgi:Zn-dependent protease with chaperone function
MRGLLIIFVALACGAARGEDTGAAPGIVAVLHNSQQLRLDAMALADRDSPRAQRLRESFDMLVRHLRTLPPVELRVARGEVFAETLQGKVIVGNEALADLSEGERLFALAHELGHVMLGHWAQLGLLYQKWVPGAVRQEHTDAVAARLGADASALAHRQEFEADAFGLRTLRGLGRSEQDALAVFMRLGVRHDTATHPSTRKRVAALRAVEPDSLQAAAASAGR